MLTVGIVGLGPEFCGLVHGLDLGLDLERTGLRLTLYFRSRISVLQLASSRESVRHLRCENSVLVIVCPLLLINGTEVTILWEGLAKCSKEISCSRNLLEFCDFYDAEHSTLAATKIS